MIKNLMTQEDHKLFITFIEDETEGKEKREVIYEKATTLMIDLIEKRKSFDVSNENFIKMISHFITQVNYFGDFNKNVKIYSFFMLAYSTKENLKHIKDVDIIDLYEILGEERLYRYNSFARGYIWS